MVRETTPLQEQQLIERFLAMVEAENRGERIPRDKRVTIEEALMSTDLAVLVRRTIIDTMRDTAEPVYLGSKLLQRVRLTEGRTLIFPSLAPLRAQEVGEAQEYPEADTAVQLHEATSTEVKLRKYGLRIALSEEALEASQWDVLGHLVRQAGRAMARYLEEWIWREFERHGHVAFDGSTIDSNGNIVPNTPEGLAPRGLDYNAKYNGTLSVEDVFDMLVGLMVYGFNPTDVIMHPLTWPLFAKQELLGNLNAPALGYAAQLPIRPEDVQGRLPNGITIQLSPWVPFDRTAKRYTMFIIDRNHVGVLAEKDDITTEEWREPARDIRNIKVFARKGVGILNNGLAIQVAKNIRWAKSWPIPERMRVFESPTGFDFPKDQV